VRRDAGYVPLVTPTSQIVGSQAAFNVMSGTPYGMISNEFKMILRGEFGKTPGDLDPEFVDRILGPNEERRVYRAASYEPPVLEETYDLPFVKTHKDLLLHLVFKQSADTFLKRRYGITD
jgi:pyruvate/oxaloacetate carboxyltransferase